MGEHMPTDKSDRKKRIFELDISQLEDIQDLIFEYFFIVSELLSDQRFDLQKIKLDIDSNKIVAEGWERTEEDSEEDTEPDFTWV
jgi:hypothetical protein